MGHYIGFSDTFAKMGQKRVSKSLKNGQFLTHFDTLLDANFDLLSPWFYHEMGLGRYMKRGLKTGPDFESKKCHFWVCNHVSQPNGHF